MASNYTSNYSLNQWAASDRVLRTEFNADNAKIDAALAGKASASALSSLQGTVNGKASASALNALQTTVDGLQTTVSGLKTSKADKTALDTLKATVTQHTAALTSKGNCQIYAASYIGNGDRGEQNAQSVTFPAVPEMVLVAGYGRHLFLFPGQTESCALGITGGMGVVTISWSGKTVRWYSTNSAGQMNENGITYYITALIQAG